MTKLNNRQWLFPLLAIPLIGCAVLFGFCTAVLNHAGEYSSPDEIITRLEKTNGVYGPSLSPRILAFKQRLYERYTPDTVAVGSLRIDQLRAEDFSVPFVNLGGTSSLDETAELCKTLFGKLKPKVLILALDFWWFLGDGRAAVSLREPEAARPGAQDLFTLAAWYAAGDLTPGDIKTILHGNSPNIGIRGVLHGDGFDRSGAFAYQSLWTGALPGPDAQFSADRDSLSHGKKVYGWGDNINPVQWQKLAGLLDFLQQSGIKTLLLLPPLAPTVLDAMAASNHYGYIDGLHMKLSELAAAYRFPLFDDHDIRFAGGSDCEFINGLHGGAIAYKRILLDMAIKDADMRARLKLPEIGWAIEHFKGQAEPLPGEKDFLGLGCKKAPAP